MGAQFGQFTQKHTEPIALDIAHLTLNIKHCNCTLDIAISLQELHSKLHTMFLGSDDEDNRGLSIGRARLSSFTLDMVAFSMRILAKEAHILNREKLFLICQFSSLLMQLK